MTSCDDDDFSIIGDDNTYTTPTNHHNTTLHHHYAVATTSHHKHRKAFCHRLPTKATPIISQSLPTQNSVRGGSPKDISGEDDTREGDDYSNGGGFCSQPDPKTNTLSFNMASVNPFATENEPDLEKCRLNPSIEKLIDRDELSDDGTPQSYKKTRFTAPLHAGGGEYRKDREEWSDNAIAHLLDAYTDKFLELNKGNLRVRDWEEVAAIVSGNCEKQKKSVEQCKNKVDNLKKRYKLERHRMSKGSISVSHWPWFQKLELIVSNSLPSKSVAADEGNSVGGSTNSFKQSKRYGTQTPSSATQINGLKSRQLANLRWRRVVFKISGAALGGTIPHNIDPKVAMLIAREVSIACRIGVEVAIVVGGRNFFCGDTWVTTTGLDRSTAYQIGMMATVMNSILLQSALEKLGVQACVQTAFSLAEVAEPYNRQRAIRHLEKGRVVIFGGVGAGTGNPLFSTDTAAALRASEIHADAVLKGTNVDGVYVCDSTNNDVVAEHISYRELASRGASAMDMMAVTFCEENGIPVLIFNLLIPGNISRALCGEQVGTLIDQTEKIG